MILVFTGGRDFEDDKLVQGVRQLAHNVEVYVGDCPTGLDEAVRDFFPHAKVFKADWARHGRSAGPIRNRFMLESAKRAAEVAHERIFLIAFPGGKGTADCTRQAHELGIPVLKLEP